MGSAPRKLLIYPTFSHYFTTIYKTHARDKFKESMFQFKNFALAP